jgi:hypothetical protein
MKVLKLEEGSPEIPVIKIHSDNPESDLSPSAKLED